jgi:hypothetical protein
MATADGDDNAYSWETGYAEGKRIYNCEPMIDVQKLIL